MKTRTLFLTLFTSIFVLLIAQGSAFADPITGCVEEKSGELYNVQIGTEPFPPCDMEDSELTWNQRGAPQFILKDSTGAQVGTVITVNDDSASFVEPFVGLQVTNRSVLTALDIQKADTTTATVAISVDRFNIRFQHRLVFVSLNCMSPPRARDIIVDSDFPPAITMSAVVGMLGQPNVRKLYVQTDEAEIPQSPLLQSVFFDDVCVNFGIPFSLPTVSMELVDDQLHLTHPGPYTLEGPAGADGTTIHQVHLEDSNSATCEAVGFPNINDPNTFGWCPNGVRNNFIIPDSMITANSVVIANLGNP